VADDTQLERERDTQLEKGSQWWWGRQKQQQMMMMKPNMSSSKSNEANALPPKKLVAPDALRAAQWGVPCHCCQGVRC
jgi:hypothetical protein